MSTVGAAFSTVIPSSSATVPLTPSEEETASRPFAVDMSASGSSLSRLAVTSNASGVQVAPSSRERKTAYVVPAGPVQSRSTGVSPMDVSLALTAPTAGGPLAGPVLVPMTPTVSWLTTIFATVAPGGTDMTSANVPSSGSPPGSPSVASPLRTTGSKRRVASTSPAAFSSRTANGPEPGAASPA